MGLDMYMTKKTYMGYGSNKIEVRYKCEEEKDMREAFGYKGRKTFKNVSTITERVMYWRKSNQIHKWIVTNVQGGKDECQECYFPEEKIKELIAVCKKVLDAKEHNEAHGLNAAKKYLPTTSGFFFGDTEYDDYYWSDVKRTYEELSKLDLDDGDYYYQSSW